MSSAEQQARDLLDRARALLVSSRATSQEEWLDITIELSDALESRLDDLVVRGLYECVKRNDTLAAELCRLRAQETRIRALCVESENEKWMREISRDATGHPICQHTVLAADILAVLDTEEGQA